MRHEPASPVIGHCLGVKASFLSLVRLHIKDRFRLGIGHVAPSLFQTIAQFSVVCSKADTLSHTRNSVRISTPAFSQA
jgi:hypothetical protein